jgi:hypothetical protein
VEADKNLKVLVPAPGNGQLEELKAQYEDLYLFERKGVSLVFKPPTREQFKRFIKETEKGDAYSATETLVKDCLVYPNRAGLDEVLRRYPGLIDPIGGDLTRLAKMEEAAFLTPL